MPQGSSVSLAGPGGRRIRLSHPQVGAGGRELTLRLPHLASAVYRVHWVAQGEDGHTVSGRFAFGVAGRGGAPPLGAFGLSAAGGSSSGGESIITIFLRWLGILAAAMLWGGVAFSFAARAGSLGLRRTLGFALAALATLVCLEIGAAFLVAYLVTGYPPY